MFATTKDKVFSVEDVLEAISLIENGYTRTDVLKEICQDANIQVVHGCVFINLYPPQEVSVPEPVVPEQGLVDVTTDDIIDKKETYIATHKYAVGQCLWVTVNKPNNSGLKIGNKVKVITYNDILKGYEVKACDDVNNTIWYVDEEYVTNKDIGALKPICSIDDHKTASELGYKEGDTFIVIDYDDYSTGQTITLTKDDNTDIPYFTNERGERKCYAFNQLAESK